MIKLVLTLRSQQDHVPIIRSFEQIISQNDFYVSCERAGRFSHRWKLTYQLEQLRPEHVDWLLNMLATDDLVGGAIERPIARTRDHERVKASFGETRPVRITFHS